MEMPFLKDLLFLFGFGLLVALICHPLRIPILVSFIITGVIAGPYSLKIIKDVSDVETLSQIGIMFLLFSIGLEFSFKRLLKDSRLFFLGGALQILFTVTLGSVLGYFFSFSLGQSLFLGFLLSMSSTAIVLKALAEDEDVDSLHGRLTAAILIFQDMAAVPMIALLPILMEQSGHFNMAFLLRFLLGLAFISAVFFLSLKVIPKLLFTVAKMRSRELFLLTVLTLCFSIAWLASKLGLTLSIGAFLAGMIISETEYKHEALGDVLPFQDVFLSLFFISIGMLFNIHFLFENFFVILALSLGVMLLKALAIGLTGFCLRIPFSVTFLTAIALCQVGEFSFVLAKSGSAYNLISPINFQFFLAVALISMAATPSLIKNGHTFLRILRRYFLPAHTDSDVKSKIKDHIVIIGYGVAGRAMATAAKEAGLPYQIVEMDPEVVNQERRKGEPILFGDPSHEHILKHINVQEAKAVSIMIEDPYAAKAIVILARRLSPRAYIIVRTKFVKDRTNMLELGADDAIPDEIGTSLEIFARVLQQYRIDQTRIDELVAFLRLNCYEKMCAFEGSFQSIYEDEAT